jgi:hypothetical protein
MRNLLIILILFCSLSVACQEKQEITQQDYTNHQVEMADQFRADGKIYVVVGIVVLILGGLLAYAVAIDRKVSRLERLADERLHPQKDRDKWVAG